ncbi:MAG: oligosaccharide flippase family protein, partial [Flavobacteriaceae bacterium]|nr:oligosaccharide flippase family protein [Flavobacteriaceae bacterium]
RISYPMALSAVSFFLMQSVDIILLGKFEQFNTVAYYGVAVKLATTGTLAILSVNVILAPKIAEFFELKRFDDLSKILKRGTRLMVLISLPVLGILAVFSPFVLGLFGNDYKIATEALRILLLGQVINALCGTVGIYMNMTGKQRKLNVILIIGLVINIVLNYIFIPKYGMVGAASATAISMVIWKIIAVTYNYSKDRVITFVR